MSKRAIKQGKWQWIFDFDFGNRDFFTIVTDRYKIVMSGGSVSVSDSRTGEQLFQKGGFIISIRATFRRTKMCLLR